ncbi:MAG: hypothetical protein ACXAC8_00775 [Candidatus Hodarchaeales archaeon]|jgi:hypothetical protein
MSTWQSFFNQLAKPIKKEMILVSNEICHCSKGAVLFCGDETYHSEKECSLSSACCEIQIDKHRSYVMNRNITISDSTELSLLKKFNTPSFSLDSFLNG